MRIEFRDRIGWVSDHVNCAKVVGGKLVVKRFENDPWDEIGQLVTLGNASWWVVRESDSVKVYTSLEIFPQ